MRPEREIQTPGPWHVTTNQHRNTDGSRWGCVEAIRHPAGGAGSPPGGMGNITWRGDMGLANAKLVAAAPQLADALEGLLMLFPEGDEGSTEQFERIAAQFMRETGYMRPGKDQPDAMPFPDREEREQAWSDWIEGKQRAARQALKVAGRGD